jgi:hypothetical protein
MALDVQVVVNVIFGVSLASDAMLRFRPFPPERSKKRMW